MTRDEAAAEAARRWGPYVAVQGPTCNLADQPEYMVQEIVPGPVRDGQEHYDNIHPTHWGIGPTWEAAFADADRRAAENGA